MARKFVNRENIEGRVYDHNLVLKVTGETSKHPGTEYIRGTLDVATDEDCLNVVTVNFTYVTATTSKGNRNDTFFVLKNILDGASTVISDGKDAAAKVKISTAVGLNEFYTDRNGQEELVSVKINDGGFVTNVTKLNKDEKERNKFECDMIINGTKYVEADEERHIDEDYLIVKGVIFNFKKDFLPVEFIIKTKGGIDYFESLEASSSNPIFTKVWGNVTSQTIVTRKEEESAFGESIVKEYESTKKFWVITGAAREPYVIGDETNGITADEIKEGLATRQTYLADMKKRNEEWKNSQAASKPAQVSTGATAAAGGFNF